MKKQTAGAYIRFIGYDPFLVHFATKFQKNAYKVYAKEEPPCLFIDASGNICSKIYKDNEPGGQIFLYYICVINCRTEQFSVNQMLSEAHDAGNFMFWLLQWIRAGFPPPKETVADGSKALLTGIVKAVCGYLTVEDYANSCLRALPLPNCYVRFDIAHFIKLQSNFLSKVPRLVKLFYLGVIGRIIVCTDLIHAEEIFKSVLILCQSEASGLLQGTTKEKMVCERSKLFLTALIST